MASDNCGEEKILLWPLLLLHAPHILIWSLFDQYTKKNTNTRKLTHSMLSLVTKPSLPFNNLFIQLNDTMGQDRHIFFKKKEKKVKGNQEEWGSIQPKNVYIDGAGHSKEGGKRRIVKETIDETETKLMGPYTFILSTYWKDSIRTNS